MQLTASDRLYRELNIVRRVRRLRSVGILLKALSGTVDSAKIIETAKFYAMKERNEGSESDEVSGVSSGGDEIIYKGPLTERVLVPDGSKVSHSRSDLNVSMTGQNEQAGAPGQGQIQLTGRAESNGNAPCTPPRRN